MKLDYKTSLIQGIITALIILFNHITDYLIDLGYQNIVFALLRAYFIASAGVFLGIWRVRYINKKEKNNEN